jgi:hypothetical protein
MKQDVHEVYGVKNYGSEKVKKFNKSLKNALKRAKSIEKC